MLKLNFKDKLKDSLLAISSGLCLLLALIGLCVGSIKQTIDLKALGGMGTATEVASYGDLASGNGVSRTGLAFAIIGFILLVILAALVVLEYLEKYNKITRFKLYVGIACLVCTIISFACVGAFACDLNGALGGIGATAKVAAGSIINFIFSVLAVVCMVMFNRSLKFWQTPQE